MWNWQPCPAADKLLVWDHLEVPVCGSGLEDPFQQLLISSVIEAAAKAFTRDHMELAIRGSNLSSSLPLAWEASSWNPSITLWVLKNLIRYTSSCLIKVLPWTCFALLLKCS